MKTGITYIIPGEARGVKAKTSYSYKRVLEGYKEWLDIIGYSKDTVNSLPNQLNPFFLHMKKEGVNNLQEVPKQTIQNYYQALKQNKSKHKARYVPFVESQKQDFELYLQHCRKPLATGDRVSFLLNNQRKRMSSTAVSKVLKSLIERTENGELQEKKPGLHTLRHSIATHLLQSGMGIESISQFLGHQRIRSTQTYLHHVE